GLGDVQEAAEPAVRGQSSGEECADAVRHGLLGHRRSLPEAAVGGPVQQVRQVLAVQDLGGVEVAVRRDDPSGEHLLGCVQVVLVAGAARYEGDGERVAGAASGAADALRVVGGRGRQGGQQYGGQVADVDAEFEGGRTGQHVRVEGRAAQLECLLDLLAAGPAEGARVLGGEDVSGAVDGVEAAVVVVA